MIGKAYKSLLPYYDMQTRSTRFKSRPCLVIGQADVGDYVILPISSINDKRRVHPEYDIELDNSEYSFLNKTSFVRTHKQTTLNKTMIRDMLCDFRSDYEEKYSEILSKVEEFQNDMIKNAL